MAGPLESGRALMGREEEEEEGRCVGSCLNSVFWAWIWVGVGAGRPDVRRSVGRRTVEM